MKHRLLLILLLLAAKLDAADQDGWIDFNPPLDSFEESAIDLRRLNEAFAGEHGYIEARGGEFIHGANRQPVRFWGVNGPPSQLRREDLPRCARRLAKYGVNLVRMHGAVFNKAGDVDPAKVSRIQDTVTALKAEGIYSLLSIYFPLWMQPSPDHPWLKGYDGKKHPFAALMFNPEFQEHYRQWWKAVLLTPDAQGRKLIDEAALFAVEIQNEDSFFFWTFNPDQIPDPQMRLIESRFGAWLKRRYGSLEAALAAWGGQKVARDSFVDGRVGFRPLWNIANEKSARDRDTAQFLFETQRHFYEETIRFLRGIGFKGLITPSNWQTASPEVLGPLEKWSYATGDFLDRHGYFSVSHKGENAEWSIRNGHAYADRSALRFDSETPGKPKPFVNPVMDITYAGKPSMISETTWNRPNRYRSEAPLSYACYGALQGSDAIVHFALDGAEWSVKPGYFMQPWTLMAPSQFGQFPAAALIYRLGLVKTGDVLAKIQLNTNDLLKLKGTPLPQDASFDELRMKDVPQGTELNPGQRIDPLIHYAGRTEVEFTESTATTTLHDLKPFIDRSAKTVRSSTRELSLNYEKGLLAIDAPKAQGASGNLKSGGVQEFSEITVQSDMDNAHIVLVSLDGEPLGRSKRLLLQAMSEERATGFAAESGTNNTLKITNIGRDPWQFKALQGTLQFKNPAGLQIQPLDFIGRPKGVPVEPAKFSLQADTLYYLVTRQP